VKIKTKRKETKQKEEGTMKIKNEKGVNKMKEESNVTISKTLASKYQYIPHRLSFE